MGHTLLVKNRPYMLDFYLPINGRGSLDNGTELHVQLTLTPYEIVTRTKHTESLAEVVIQGMLGLYRYTAIFPNQDWSKLCIYDTVALQRESLEQVAERHDVILGYAGPVVKHRVRPHDTMMVTDELPIFDQYYDADDYPDWRLGIEHNGRDVPLYIPYCTKKAIS